VKDRLTLDMNRYRELMAFPQVIRLGISAFPARLPTE